MISVRADRLSVNIISESAFTVRGHGVHSAFEDLVERARCISEFDTRVNSLWKADIAHAHTVGPISLFLLTRGTAHRVITTHIDTASLSGSIRGGRVLLALASRYLKWFYSKADTLIALNETQARELSLELPGANVIVSRNPPPSHLTLRPKSVARDALGLLSSSPLVLTVGQLQTRKGVKEFVETARQLPHIQFIWVGGFPFGWLTDGYRELKALSSEDYPNIKFAGRVPRAQVFDYYSAADVYFHPSHHENSCVAVLEAAAYGLPLVLREHCYDNSYENCGEFGDDSTFAEMIDQLTTTEDARIRGSMAASRFADEMRAQDAILDLYNTVHEAKLSAVCSTKQRNDPRSIGRLRRFCSPSRNA